MDAFHGAILIPEPNVSKLVKKVEAVAKRIRKGKTTALAEPYAIPLHEVSMITGYICRAGGLSWREGVPNIEPYDPARHDKNDCEPELRPYRWVELFYEAPHISGWRLTGTVDWEDDMCIVNPVPGESVPKEYWNIEAGRCDHCKIHRNRRKSMIIKHDDGRMMVVGSTCLKDYLGHIEANTLIEMMRFVMEIDTVSTDLGEDWGTTKIDFPFSLRNVLAAANHFVENYGYVRSMPYEPSDIPTKINVMNYLDPATPHERDYVRHNPLTQKDYDKADDVTKMMLNFDDSNEYGDTLRKIAQNGTVSRKRMGVAVSAVYVYNRENEKQREREATYTVADEYIGTVGERLRDIPVTVVGKKVIDSFYGTTTVVRMIDDGGHVLVWFGSGYRDEAVEGEQYKIDGTVKKQEKYRGTKQTVLNRVRMGA